MGYAVATVHPAFKLVMIGEAKIMDAVGLWNGVVTVAAFCDHRLDLAKDLQMPHQI